jgi:hypothetical protein
VFNGGAVGLGRTTAELFDIKSGHKPNKEFSTENTQDTGRTKRERGLRRDAKFAESEDLEKVYVRRYNAKHTAASGQV